VGNSLAIFATALSEELGNWFIKFVSLLSGKLGNWGSVYSGGFFPLGDFLASFVALFCFAVLFDEVNIAVSYFPFLTM